MNDNKAITRAQDYTNPFEKKGLGEHVNQATVSIESDRAIATVQAKVIMARRYRRDPEACFEKIKEACSRLSMAEDAFYEFPRGGKVVSGPTVQLAEELVRLWTNIDTSVMELSRREGETEIMVTAWDMEDNVSSTETFTVKHWLNKKEGGRELKEQRDIRDAIASVASRKIRRRILAVLPKEVVNGAVEMCHMTLAKAVASNLKERRIAIFNLLKDFQVTERAILDYFQKKSIDQVNAEEVVKLNGIYRAIKTKAASAEEIFVQHMTSKDIAERAKAQQRSTKQTTQKQPPAQKQEQQRQQTTEKQRTTEPQQQEIKEGTVQWYRREITRMGGTVPPGAKKEELQGVYAELKENQLREQRKYKQQEQKQEQKTETAQDEPPAEMDLDDIDPDFDADFFQE